MTRKFLFIVMVVFAIVIGLYPCIYFIIDRKFGLLSSKPDTVLTNAFWNIAFYTHIILGGFALLAGWLQFIANFRNRYPVLHRSIGMSYIVAVVLSAIAGIYIGFFATGGVLSAMGFEFLGMIWLITTVKAYTHIRNGLIKKHQVMMMYSYAACFAAVTLRIWLPILIIIFDNFLTAYTVVAWLCWVPNLLFAYLLSKKIKPIINQPVHGNIG